LEGPNAATARRPGRRCAWAGRWRFRYSVPMMAIWRVPSIVCCGAAAKIDAGKNSTFITRRDCVRNTRINNVRNYPAFGAHAGGRRRTVAHSCFPPRGTTATPCFDRPTGRRGMCPIVSAAIAGPRSPRRGGRVAERGCPFTTARGSVHHGADVRSGLLSLFRQALSISGSSVESCHAIEAVQLSRAAALQSRTALGLPQTHLALVPGPPELDRVGPPRFY